MKAIKWLDKRFEETLVVILISIFVLASVIQVVTRFLPDVNGSWTEEVARYSFIWMTFIGAAVASKANIQVRVDILENIIKSQKARSILRTVCDIIFLVFIVLMLYYGILVCKRLVVNPQKSPVLQMDMIYVYAALPVGMALTAFREIQRIWRKVVNKRKENA